MFTGRRFLGPREGGNDWEEARREVAARTTLAYILRLFSVTNVSRNTSTLGRTSREKNKLPSSKPPILLYIRVYIRPSPSLSPRSREVGNGTTVRESRRVARTKDTQILSLVSSPRQHASARLSSQLRPPFPRFPRFATICFCHSPLPIPDNRDRPP